MTYEYFCSACAHEWEAEQPISEAPLKTCPACGGETARRQVSGGQGFILKGGGWYADGYGLKKNGAVEKPKPASSESKAEPSAAAKPETKTEPKADSAPAKTDTKSGPKTS